MRFQPGETIRILGLEGQIASCSDSSALAEFGASGFLHVSILTEGPHDAVIVVSLPRLILAPSSLPELRRQVCSTFDLHPDLRIAIRLSEPLKFGESGSQHTSQSGQVYDAELAPGSPSSYASMPNDGYGYYGSPNQYARQPYQTQPSSPPSFQHAPSSVIDDWLDAWNRHFATEPKHDLYSVPRRYDLASMFAISVAYAILFAGMRALSAPPSSIVLTGIFFTMIGISQAVLFKGNRPRESSILVGVIGGLLCLIVFGFTAGMSADEAILATICGVFCSPFAGYLAGASIGGIWLVADYLRMWLEKSAVAESPSGTNDLDSTEPTHPLGN